MTRAGGLAIALALACAAPASALPVFARRYDTPCSTCHVQFPKLNPFGEAFRRNGYQFPGGADADAIKQPPVVLVDPARRALFPRSFWPSDLPASLPAALAVDAAVPIFPDPNTRPVGEQAISFDKLFGRLELLVAARLGADVSVFASADLNSATGVELQRGFLVVSNLFGPSLLNVRVGQFEPQIFGFSDYRRLGGPSYLLFSTSPDHSQWHSQWNPLVVRGVDLSGTVGGRFGWNAAYVQGVEGSYTGDGIKQIPRDGYLRAFVKLGGLRLDGLQPGGAVGGAARERSLTVGGFLYGGRHDVDTAGTPAVPPEGDLMYKAGGEVDLLLGPFELVLAAAYESHRFDVLAPESRLQALGEASLVILPWLAVIARAEAELFRDQQGVRLTPIVSLHPRINLKVQVWAQIERPLSGGDLAVTELDLAARYAF